MGGLLMSVADFIFPRECHICGTALSSASRYVCPACLAGLPRTRYHRVKDNPMERRFMGQFPFRNAAGHFFYSRESGLAVLMHDLKYRQFRGLARFMGELVGRELLVTGFFSEIDLIVPVPMHFFKKALRGYNQTEEIAKGLSEVTDIPVSLGLKAVRRHRTQTSRTLKERVKNVEGVFHVSCPVDLEGKKILLLDDVCTTGSTLCAAAVEIVRSVRNVELTLLTIGVTF